MAGSGPAMTGKEVVDARLRGHDEGVRALRLSFRGMMSPAWGFCGLVLECRVASGECMHSRDATRNDGFLVVGFRCGPVWVAGCAALTHPMFVVLSVTGLEDGLLRGLGS